MPNSAPFIMQLVLAALLCVHPHLSHHHVIVYAVLSLWTAWVYRPMPTSTPAIEVPETDLSPLIKQLETIESKLNKLVMTKAFG